MRIKPGNYVLALSACAAALALSGCGGGGSGGGSVEPIPAAPAAPPPPPPPAPPPPPPPPPAPTAINYNDAEYNRSNGANAHGAIAAYNAGGTGQGVKIGIIDSGINPNLAEFAGKIDPASRDIASTRGVTDTEGHGTAVSAVAAGARNGLQMHGVAFDATIISMNTSNPNDCDDEDGCKHRDSDIAQGIDAARVAGARVINISLGGDGAGIAVLNAVYRATSAGIVIVMSAGNKGKEPEGINPGGFSLSSAQQAGNGLVIIAGAHDANRNITDFSNKAGTGAAYYLTALGDRVRTINEEGVGYLYSGTSFAAPVISGAAALLASAFPNLTGAQIVKLLLTTADDAGVSGRDALYGNGILNIQRAFQPQGQTALAGSSQPVDTSGGGQGSGAMGNAFRGQPAGAIILDGYSRAYAVNFAARLESAAQERPLTQSLGGDRLSTAAVAVGKTSVSLTTARDPRGALQLRLTDARLNQEDAGQARAIAGIALSRITPRTAIAFGISESGQTLRQRLAAREANAFMVARDPMTRMGFNADAGSAVGVRHEVGPVALTLTNERGKVYDQGRERFGRSAYDISSVSADRRIGPVNLTLGGTRLEEENSVLGGRFSSAFTAGGSTSYFADGSASLGLGGGWNALASYRHGWTSTPGTGALVERGRLSTNAFAFDLSKAGAFTGGDKLAFRVMQPLRVASGGFDMKVPVSYDYSTGSVGYENRFFNLAPTGREIDYEVAYGVDALGGNLGLNAFLRTDPGHIKEMKSDVGAAVRFTLGF